MSCLISVKRKSRALRYPKTVKCARIECDICETLSSLTIGFNRFGQNKVKIGVMSDLVGAMESLKLCDCLKVDCFPCVSRNLMHLGDAFIDLQYIILTIA